MEDVTPMYSTTTHDVLHGTASCLVELEATHSEVHGTYSVRDNTRGFQRFTRGIRAGIMVMALVKSRT